MATIIICRTCGREQALPDGLDIAPCIACGTMNSKPRADEHGQGELRRATAQRLRCDFVHAESSYQYVLRECPEEHEAIWGLVQCRYGIEYVNDPRSGKPMPIVHAVRRRPMLTDPDFREACDLAPESVRAQYRQEAEYIDGAMARIRELAARGEKYDVFLCHKTSRTDGIEGYTEDFKRATQLYVKLEKAGYSVFFAPFAGLTPGENYEAGIYHALDTAKVMLVVCSNAEYINSPWVRTEWQRFLEMSYEDGADKHLIPLLYDSFPPRRLPDDFRQLQAIAMGELDATEMLMAAVEAHAGKPVAEPEPKKPEPAPKPAQPAPAYAPESDFITETVEGGVSITGYTGPGGEVLIPSTIGGRQVTGIGDKAFEKQKSLTRVVIPEGVTSIGTYAFLHCSSLTSVNIPEGMTSIGGYAFFDCGLLERVHIPESLMRLDENPFTLCSALKSIMVAAGNRRYYTLDNVLLSRDGELVCYPMSLTAASYTVPGFVTRIGEYAFYCSKLKTVSIPESVVRIGDTAFAHCSSLTSVDIPAGVTRIGDWTFQCCSSLTSVTIPAGVTSIGGYAFASCSSLTKVNIPAGVTSIEDSAFEGCSSLANVMIPESVRTIERAAFQGCSSLTSVSVPAGVTTIGLFAFNDCPALTLRVHTDTPAHKYAQENNLRFEVIAAAQKPVQPVGEGLAPSRPAAQPAPAYAPESDFDTEAVEGGVTITGYTGPGGEVLIPPTIGGGKVVRIEASAFIFCSSLTNVIIPLGVTSIGNSAFYGCSSLTSMMIPEGVTSIGKRAFNFCDNLESVGIPESVVQLGGINPFEHCAALKSISVAAGNGEYYARDNVLLSRNRELVCYPAGLSASSYTIPDFVTNIGESAFLGCSSLINVIIPESVTTIGSAAFHGCSSLTSVSVPAGVTSIGLFAFNDCPALTLRVHTDTPAHKYAQENNLRFEVIAAAQKPAQPVGEGLTPSRPAAQPAPAYAPESDFIIEAVEGGVCITGYFGSDGEVFIPATIDGKQVVEIGEKAFEHCDEVHRVVIPSGVTSIGRFAFWYCSSLKSVHIPESVTNFGYNPFVGCKALTAISVAAGNKKYYDRDGVLMSHDNEEVYYPTVVVRYPAGLAATSYTIPAGVMSIGDCAFEGCSRLTSVDIPKSVKHIGQRTFADCTNLTKVSIPASVKDNIGYHAFEGCTQLPLLQKMKLKMMGAM